jgi:hypothetical protein
VAVSVPPPAPSVAVSSIGLLPFSLSIFVSPLPWSKDN